MRGTNLFFHEVTSGTCASNGLESIVSKELCILAADYHGFKYYSTTENNNAEAHDLLEGCFMEPQLELPFEPSGFLSGLNKNLIVSVNETCKPMKTDCQCTMQKPCFCTSKNFVQRNRDNPYGRRMNMNGQFVVNWALSLGEYDSLLENTFLRFAFEQSVKDYINNDIFCSDDPAAKGAEFFGVEIPEPIEDKEGKLMAISGNGKCKGDFTKCKVDLKKAKKPKRIGEHATGEVRLVKATDADDDFCEIFKNQTVFDAFKEKLLMASAFNYAVDVDVINDLEGSIDLSYDVSFEPAPSEGLDQVDSVDMAATDPDPVDPVCTDSQCSTQADVMRNIFSYFDIPIDGDKHECLYQGINCNSEDLVTHIWMGKYIFALRQIILLIETNKKVNVSCVSLK